MKFEAYKELWRLARHYYEALIIDKNIEIPNITDKTEYEDIYSNEPWNSLVIELINEVTGRMNEAIKHAIELRNKKEKAEIHTDFWMLPPTVAISSDIQQGTTQLIYGKESSCSFALIDDFTSELIVVWTNHLIEGFPVDKFYLAPILPGHEGDNDLFCRRHLKLGERLKDIPKKKDRPLVNSAKYILDILHDIRNEMHPEWAKANFFVCVALLSGGFNQLVMKSNYDVLATIWDGVNSKSKLGFDEQYFFYYPWPPILNTLFAMPREIWVQRLTSLTTKGRFYINHQVTDCKNMNEIFGRDRVFVPNKEQILKAEIPSLKDGRDKYVFPEIGEPISADIEGRTFLD